MSTLYDDSGVPQLFPQRLKSAFRQEPYTTIKTSSRRLTMLPSRHVFPHDVHLLHETLEVRIAVEAIQHLFQGQGTASSAERSSRTSKSIK